MRAGWSWSCSVLVVVLVLGCASTEGVAQERRGQPDSKPTKDGEAGDDAKSGAATKKKDAPADPKSYLATVVDKSRAVDGRPSEPFKVRKAVVFVPEVTLFGGGSGNEVKQLKIRRGSAEVTVPFSRVAKMEFGDAKEDRLPVTITLRGVKDPKDAKLVGTVKASLELRGNLGATNLDTVVRLRDTQSVELAQE